MTLRIYLRRSRAEEGKQEFSLDVQRQGCAAFATRLSALLGARLGKPVEYVDDGIAGDDFVGRAGLARLMADAKKGDVILARDQSRIGRNALEVTLAITQLTQDKSTRVFYYSDGGEARCDNVISQTMTFIRGVGGQMELEALRSRTREGLRARVHAGFIAGGRCFGYRNIRESDASGRARTRMEVEPIEADVVRRIFRERVEGRGFKQIAIRLNNDGLKSPRAGRRGTGTWSPGAIYEVLQRERYRGVYVHGEYDRPRKGGRRLTVPASPESVLRVDRPEWRIIDDETWFAVQAMRNAHTTRPAPGPRSKYPLTGLVRCGRCGGSVGVVPKRVGNVNVQAYACSYHHYRGDAACAVTVRQPRTEVEGYLADYVREKVLGSGVEDEIVARVQAEVARRLAGPSTDVQGLEAELLKVEREKANLVNAIAAGGGDVAELVEAVKVRKATIAQLQSRLASSKEGPVALRRAQEFCGPYVRSRLAELRSLIGRPSEDARRGWRALFPDGIVFQPIRVGRRHVWRAQATAKIASGGPGFGTFTLDGDPSGIRTRVHALKGHCPRPS